VLTWSKVMNNQGFSSKKAALRLWPRNRVFFVGSREFLRAGTCRQCRMLDETEIVLGRVCALLPTQGDVWGFFLGRVLLDTVCK
jgi:hypothetical protein